MTNWKTRCALRCVINGLLVAAIVALYLRATNQQHISVTEAALLTWVANTVGILQMHPLLRGPRFGDNKR